jgi:glycosyltransferase involved in cell wall biosynthesis
VSIAPIFPDHVIGGSQKILVDVAAGLKARGHDIQIWCTGIGAHEGDFEIANVPVHPGLMLRGSFPATHQVSPAALAKTSEVLREAADWGDRVYLHADAVYLRHAIEGSDIIRSIHDFVYEEALLSTLTLPADATIVPSEYLKRCVEATVAISGKTSIERVIAVPNGVDVPESLPGPALPNGVAPRGENDLVLLFPHRPEPTKGVREAILTAIEVQKLDAARNVRLLMPAYPPDSHHDDAAGSAQEIKNIADEMDASEIVELHDWLSPSEMPGYYAAGDVTLCLGSFVESFGLVPVESVANGTPAVCARVGALRQFEDVDGIALVPYGEANLAAEAIVSFCSDRSGVAEQIKSGRSQIETAYSPESMISEYESVISRSLTGARKIQFATDDTLVAAPWCDLQGDRIYNDYDAAMQTYPRLTQALRSGGGSVSADPLLLSASLDAEVRHATEHGVLIPAYSLE